MKLHEIIEEWAEKFKPINHQPTVKNGTAFYLIDSLNTENGFVRNHNVCKSPCMAYSTVIDAELASAGKAVDRQVVIYLLARQPASTQSLKSIARNDEETELDIKLMLDGYVQELLNYLAAIKRTGKNPITEEQYDDETLREVKYLQLDQAKWGSLPEKFESWWVVGMEMIQLVPRNTCVTTSSYTVE